MPKLKTIKPMVATLKPRIATMRETRDTRYSAGREVRGWYKSTRWIKLRQLVLVRDNYTCQRTGEICSGKHPAPNSPVVNHRIPHKDTRDASAGDRTFFSTSILHKRYPKMTTAENAIPALMVGFCMAGPPFPSSRVNSTL